MREQFLNNMRNRPQSGDSAKLLNHLEAADKEITEAVKDVAMGYAFQITASARHDGADESRESDMVSGQVTSANVAG